MNLAEGVARVSDGTAGAFELGQGRLGFVS